MSVRVSVSALLFPFNKMFKLTQSILLRQNHSEVQNGHFVFETFLLDCWTRRIKPEIVVRLGKARVFVFEAR